MNPKFLLGLALVLSGGLFSISSSAKGATTLFPITEMELKNGRALTNLPGAFTNDSSLAWMIDNVNFKFGFIDASGKIAIPPNTNWLLAGVEEGHFAEGLEPMQIPWKPGMKAGETFGYLDTKGKFAIAPQFSLALPFSEGLAAVRSLRGYGYIDHAGNYVIAPQFEYAYAFSEGLAEVVDTNHLMGFINRRGEWVIQPHFRAYSPRSKFSEGLACVPTNDVTMKFPFESGASPQFKWGYINKKGKLVIGFKFKAAAAFSEGMAAVEEINTPMSDAPPVTKFGYIDKTGAYVIPPKFEMAWNFSEGLARVQAGREMAFINRRGEVIFTVTNGGWADEFSEGLANVSIRAGVGKEIWGYINRSGQFVIKPQFQQAKPFYHGLAQVVSDGKLAYIDQSGHTVWKQP